MKGGFIVLFLASAVSLRAGDLDIIGVTALRQVDPTLTGKGVEVAQAEAPVSTNSPPPFEVSPAYVGQPTNLFTWISSLGTATSFPNSVGAESGHTDTVGANFYGVTNGPATNIVHVDNYECVNFFNAFIAPGFSIPARVVNQSFIYDSSVELLVNTNYDDYAAQHGTIFLNGIYGAGGSPPICPPGSSYNGIGVGAYYAFNLPGPTDDGRCKPDIIAPDLAEFPNGAVSYTTPYVAGTAAILVQAANRRDGGANTNAAGDLRTIKALLLNGAIKPNGWTNGTSAPLDARYGAGMVNVLNSWEQLKGGQHAFIEFTTNSSGGTHPPGTNSNNEPVLVGWDYNTNSTTASTDTAKHYYFNLPGGNPCTQTATLVWNKQSGKAGINNLNLFLYNTANSNLVTCSTSQVDNVEHIFLPALAPGRYDLQVLKLGSAGQVSASEPYALAFEIFTMPLSARETNNQVVISWPVAPTGFQLQSAGSLNPPVSWATVTNPVTITTNQDLVSLPVGGGSQFFRLVRPSF